MERNTTLFRESADIEVGRLTPQINHLLGAWILGSCMDESRGKVRKHSEKDHFILAIIP